MLKFTIEKKLEGTLARAGMIETKNGVIKTPAFVTVGTKATVKALTADQIRALGAQVVLANTYHLYLQPGEDIVAKGGGFGPMMDWHGPTMTDSGGFQAFSLGAAFGTSVSKVATDIVETNAKSHTPGQLAKVTEDGVLFRSIHDGSKHLFTPENVMDIQRSIGGDIIMAFDECPPGGSEYKYAQKSMQLTHRWLDRCFNRFNSTEPKYGYTQNLFPIVQGGTYKDLRKESWEYAFSKN